jgi:hypothetical protein
MSKTILRPASLAYHRAFAHHRFQTTSAEATLSLPIIPETPSSLPQEKAERGIDVKAETRGRKRPTFAKVSLQK